jgi:hypothetical protein
MKFLGGNIQERKCGKMITTVMNQIYGTATFPAVWKRTSFHMTNKSKGEIKDSVNYKDVSLFSALLKIHIGMLSGRMVVWDPEERHYLLFQMGFGKGTNITKYIFKLRTIYVVHT